MIPLEREEIFDYAKRVYGTEPEYIWEEYPECAILRIKNTDQWYGVFMAVERKELGLQGDGKVEILNVQCAPETAAILVQSVGFLPGYRMDSHWISVLLDGTVGETKILDALDRSYDLVDGLAER